MFQNAYRPTVYKTCYGSTFFRARHVAVQRFAIFCSKLHCCNEDMLVSSWEMFRNCTLKLKQRRLGKQKVQCTYISCGSESYANKYAIFSIILICCLLYLPLFGSQKVPYHTDYRTTSIQTKRKTLQTFFINKKVRYTLIHKHINPKFSYLSKVHFFEIPR